MAIHVFAGTSEWPRARTQYASCQPTLTSSAPATMLVTEKRRKDFVGRGRALKAYQVLTRLCLICSICGIFLAQRCQVQVPPSGVVHDYYVATTGDDTNPGTESQPWATIQRGVDALKPGDELHVRGGLYQETVNITQSGTADAPIKIIAYPEETPVVEGDNHRLPSGTWGALFAVRGDYVESTGFEVCYSNWIGVIVSGLHSTISKFNSHHNKENGILVTGDYSITQDSRVWQNCYSNVNGSGTRVGWASGLSAARHPKHAVLRRNTVYMNWGEGLSTYEANGTVLEDNRVYDNKTNIYISDATNVIVQRNLVYHSVNSPMTYGEHIGIMMGDEKYNPPSANIIIINNLVQGNLKNIYWWQGTSGGGMVNVLIANNTLANAYPDAGIVIHSGPHRNVRILNNIVVQDNGQPAITLYSLDGITLGNNLWSKSPPKYARSDGDIVGDPLLKRINLGTSDWFKLLPSSPAIGRALPLVEVTVDFFGTPRDTVPDIGGYETPAKGTLATTRTAF